MQPLISAIYGNPFAVAWGNFTTGFFLSFISLGILTYLVVKQGSAEKSLLIVWSLVILVAILGQRRFGYYFAVNVALLTGYLSWRTLELAGFRELTTKAKQVIKGARSRKVRPKKGGFTINHAVMVLAVLVIFFVAFFWNIEPATIVASQAPYAPSDAWMSSLYWLKENTPEPFGDPDFYYQMEASYSYPESAYGVMAWWDYGYSITRIAHRLPNANPGQDPRAVTRVASFFTSQDEEVANEIAQELGSAYIIIDHATAYIDPVTAAGKFWAVAIWAGRKPTDYFDLYLLPQEDGFLERPLYYPEYYRSLAVRLYNFNGEAVTPESVWVISYQETPDETGKLHKLITGAEQLSTYEEAEAYLLNQESSNQSSNLRIIGTNPMLSPVPLEALEHYQLIHSSNITVTFPDGMTAPEVKIFEYID